MCVEPIPTEERYHQRACTVGKKEVGGAHKGLAQSVLFLAILVIKPVCQIVFGMPRYFVLYTCSECDLKASSNVTSL